MNQFESLIFEKQDAIARITLHRPEAANGLNSQMARELKQAAKLCDAGPQIKVVVLSAQGRFFCAGGDLREMLAHGDAIGEAAQTLADDFHAAIALFANMQAVLIIAVNGVAAGGGFSLALIGDIVLAAESASFTMAYLSAGLCPDGASSYFLPRLVAGAELQQESDRLAQQLADGARLSNAYVKKLLLAGAVNDLAAQMTLEGQLLSCCAASPDGREGIQAFFDKRKPDFE